MEPLHPKPGRSPANRSVLRGADILRACVEFGGVLTGEHGVGIAKKKYLPRIAKGAISAFALTEANVGSDPARLSTSYELTPDGKHYVIEGSKLWCTNGTIAELLVVMAKHPKTGAISPDPRNSGIPKPNQSWIISGLWCRFTPMRPPERQRASNISGH